MSQLWVRRKLRIRATRDASLFAVVAGHGLYAVLGFKVSSSLVGTTQAGSVVLATVINTVAGRTYPALSGQLCFEPGPEAIEGGADVLTRKVVNVCLAQGSLSRLFSLWQRKPELG